MKKKDVLAEIGSFEVTIDQGAAFDFLRIRSKSNNWMVSYRSDNPMFGILRSMCTNKELIKGAEVLIIMAYHLTNSILDKEFVEDFFKALESLNQRALDKAPKATAKEDAQALEEVRTMDGLQKEFDKIKA